MAMNHDDSNEPRADWAMTAVLAFLGECGTDPEDAIGDLVCNLGHLADRFGIDGAAQIERGLRAYRVEHVECPPVTVAPERIKELEQPRDGWIGRALDAAHEQYLTDKKAED